MAVIKKFSAVKKIQKHLLGIQNLSIQGANLILDEAKNFIKNAKTQKTIVISFVVRKKTGNAVRRNRIRRKIKSIVQKLIKMNNLINNSKLKVISDMRHLIELPVFAQFKDDLLSHLKS